MISHVVAQLTTRGLVERRLGERRGVGLHATPAGTDLALGARDHNRQIHAQLQALLGERRSAALAKLLRESHAILLDAD